MPTLETDLDQERMGSTHDQPAMPAQSGTHQADRPGLTESDSTDRHFSPDPMQRTDRYRLVTPYRLSPAVD